MASYAGACPPAARADRGNAQGRRKAKTVGSTTTIYVTDADNDEVLEYDGTSGQARRWYAFGQPGPDDVLNQMNAAAGTRETMIPDIQGSIVGMLDSGGTLTRTGYQSFGENPGLTTGTFQYTARRFDGETVAGGTGAQPSGLYYFRARMYSPTWGRFLQSDPIAYQGGGNLYAYTDNDPLNFIDPSGLCDNPQGCGETSSNSLVLPEPGLTSPCIECLVVPALRLPRVLAALYDAFRLYQNISAWSIFQNMGDLTPAEVNQIQSVVNKAGRPIEVVGSAARGARQASSDIDYVAPPSSLPYFEGLEKQLPGLDTTHGIIPGVGNPNIGPVIRFEPQ